MRAMGRFLVLATISVLLSACGGGGNGKAQQVQIPDPPAAPVVTVSADIKQLIFTWDAADGANYYRFLENPDGHSGFTQVGENISRRTLSVTRDIAVHVFDWTNAQYLVEACNSIGCKSSEVVTVYEAMLDSIGYFKASNTDANDFLGSSVALSADGNTLAVDAPSEDSNATGINGDQSDNSAENAGAVYLFRFDGTGWFQQAYIKASNADSEDHFGSVSLSADGNTLAVGASSEDSNATGINGDQSDNSAENAGAVYLFRFDGTGWFQQAYIKASNADSEDYFGSVSLSADGKTLAVGASHEGSNATGINGDQADNSVLVAGAVYVFRFDGSDWFQQAYVKASNTGSDYDYFGGSLALSGNGNTLVVSATGEDSGATGINGDQFDNSARGAGAAYIFRFDGAEWYQQAYIKASNTDPGDQFSRSVAVSADGNTLAVGADREDSSATGIGGDQDNELALQSGAAYLFHFRDDNWFQRAYVKASNTEAGVHADRFGHTVALSGDGRTLVVGAIYEDSSATGIDGDQADNSAKYAGAVYLFRLESSDWIQKAYVKAPNPEFFDVFGYAIALSADGDTLAVDAHEEDSSATGIGGDQADNLAEESGAVYVY